MSGYKVGPPSAAAVKHAAEWKLTPDQRTLFEACTYARTPRLEQIVAGAEPTPHEVAELWQEYAEGCELFDQPATFSGFTEWIEEGADVGW